MTVSVVGRASLHPMNKEMRAEFEISTAATMKNAVFWDVAPSRSCVNRRLRRTYRPWRLRRYVPQKRRFTQDLDGTTSQKTAFFKEIRDYLIWVLLLLLLLL
jgi:hypothetical protein